MSNQTPGNPENNAIGVTDMMSPFFIAAAVYAEKHWSDTAKNRTMGAILNRAYGSPDILKYEEVARPAPAAGEVLVKVHAASVNAADWRLLRANPFLVRLAYGMFKPRMNILGSDVAGRVEAVGAGVNRFQPGDAVFGDLSECGCGAFAEYVKAPEDAFVEKPEGLTFEQAAAAPMAAITALQALRDEGEIQAGQKVLINGATGGVGSFALQMATAWGAEVTAVCSPKNAGLARALGARHVFDYTRQDVTELTSRYDLILDIAAERSPARFKRILNPRGTYVFVGGSTTRMFQAMCSRKNSVRVVMSKPNPEDLSIVKEMLENGTIQAVIDRRYTLREVPDAIRRLEEKSVRGKIVISV